MEQIMSTATNRVRIQRWRSQLDHIRPGVYQRQNTYNWHQTTTSEYQWSSLQRSSTLSSSARTYVINQPINK